MSSIQQYPLLITAAGGTIAPPYTLSLNEQGLAQAANTGRRPVIVSDRSFDSIESLEQEIAEHLDDQGIPHLVEDGEGIPREQPVSLLSVTPASPDAPNSEGDQDSADAPKRPSKMGRPTEMPPR